MSTPEGVGRRSDRLGVRVCVALSLLVALGFVAAAVSDLWVAVVVIFPVGCVGIGGWFGLAVARHLHRAAGVAHLGYWGARRALARARRGPVPSDEAERAEAERVMSRYVPWTERWTRWLLASQALLFVLGIFNVVVNPGVWTVLFLVFLLMCSAGLQWDVRQSRKRLEQLHRAPV